jgi:hypothetical protein
MQPRTFILSLCAASLLAIGLANDAGAAEPPVKSGSYKTQGGFKAVEETTQVGEKHTLSHGVAWGVVSGEGPLHIGTAMCPYISEATAGTINFQGKCVWSDADGDKIFTEWTGKFSASTGAGNGPQTITGGTGKFSGVQGTSPFQCQALNDKGQFTCSQQWNLSAK